MTLTVGKTQYVLILEIKTFLNNIQYISLVEMCLMVFTGFLNVSFWSETLHKPLFSAI